MALKEDEFSLGGLNSRSDLHVIMGMVLPPIAPAMSELSTDIPAKYGVHFGGIDYTTKTINIPITIMAPHNSQSYVEYAQTLAGLLLTDEPDNNREIPLVFGFQPDLTYWGHITAIADPQVTQEGAWDSTSTITFVMSDPRATMPQVEMPLKNGLNVITVDGTAQTEPVIQIIPKRALKYVGYTLNGGNYGVGPEDPIDQDNAVQEWQSVIDDPINSMALWSNGDSALSPIKTGTPHVFQGTATINEDSGSMIVKKVKGKKDYGAMPSSLAENENKWLGPGYKYNGMTQSLSEWRIKAGIHHTKWEGAHRGRAIGQIQLLWLSPNGETIGHFGISDHAYGARPECFLQITQPGGNFDVGDGTHRTFYYGYGPSGAFSNDSDKSIRIKTGTKTVSKTIRSRARNGKVTKKTINKKVDTYVTVQNRREYSALSDAWLFLDLSYYDHEYHYSITQHNLANGQPYTNPNKYFIVSSRQPVKTGTAYDTALGGFAIFFGKRPITEDIQKIDYDEPYMSLTHLQVFKHNKVNSKDTPTYIANAGSEIIMDSEAQRTTVDGKIEYPVWSTSYPKLKPGINSLNIVGDLDDAKMVLKYLPKKL